MGWSQINRRGFLAGTAGLAALAGSRATLAAKPADSTGGDVKLGVASYSLRKLPRDKAIAVIKELKTPYVNIKEFHIPYKSTPEEIAAARKEFESAGLQIVGLSLIHI